MSSLGNIYIIDDDDLMRTSLSNALTHFNYQVFSFTSARQFLEKIDNISYPAVVLLDMQMPEMNGLELQDELINTNVRCPIIFISGQSHPQQIIKALNRGANNFLLKPFLIEDLLKSIEESIELDRTYQALYEKFLTLTPREKEVFMELADGKMLKQIAINWSVSESVVKIHKSHLMKKLDVSTLQDLTKIFLALELKPSKN
jgi:FixJ family two-component response regulator